MPSATLIFPHQLFKLHPALSLKPDKVFVVEHPLFFADQEYPAKMHKQKLAYHRATMQAYTHFLESKGFDCELVRYDNGIEPLPKILKNCINKKIDSVTVCDLHDHTLEKRLRNAIANTQLTLQFLDSPGFINTTKANQEWRSTRKRWFMADFYQWQRKRLNIMMEGTKPQGGQWSFDEDNRKKLPKKLIPDIPTLPAIKTNEIIQSAISSIERDFPDSPGSLEHWYYPTTHSTAERWLTKFLEQRLVLFGPYEDAIVEDQNFLYHSVLTPMLNVGLLTPQHVVNKVLTYAETHDVPIASVEGFIRQIIGWREFMRATYEDLGVRMRTTNHWNHKRRMPQSFYNGTTGILPIDNTIKRILATGYTHHIERLMVLGGFMFLCEIDPDDIYLWFMEMFVDSYDWVMVPNVYAMSQNADGGNITTKPYFSGSNYVIKMSHYKKGEWSDIWDALFWRWIINNADGLRGNPRWAMMVRNAEKMDTEKQMSHLQVADDFFENTFS